MHNASLLDGAANDAVRLNSTRTRNVYNLPVKTRNDKEAIRVLSAAGLEKGKKGTSALASERRPA
jgi:hypothetical protein